MARETLTKKDSFAPSKVKQTFFHRVKTRTRCKRRVRFGTLLGFLLAVALASSFSLAAPVRASPSWVIQDVQSVGALGASSLALDSHGNPHILYYRFYENDYHNEANLTYASWNGSSWESQTLESSEGDGVLILDSHDNPQIAYITSTPTSSALKYLSGNGSNWNNQTIDLSLASTLCIANSALVLDQNNNPYIIYCEHNSLNTTLKYASWTGAGWNIQKIDSDAPTFDFYQASIGLDSNYYPRVVYERGNLVAGVAIDSESEVKYAEWDGQSWKIQTAFTDINSIGNVVLDSSNRPHFTCLNLPSLMYATLDGATWTVQTVDSNSLLADGSFLALDRQSNPHVCYYEEAGAGSLYGSLMYAYQDGSGWRTEVVTNNGTDAGAGPIVLDSSGRPHIAYSTHHYSDPFHYYDVKYASLAESGPSSSPSVPEFPSLMVLPLAAIFVLLVGTVAYRIKKPKHTGTAY